MWVGGRVTALAAWASDPRALTSREPWGRRCRGTHDPTRSRERSWRRRSVHKLTKSASRRRFGALVYTVATLVATRAASGGTSVPTTMTCRQHSLGGHLPLGRENRLCTSGAAARLASSPRQQPTQTPEELQKAMGPSLGGQQRVIPITWTPGNQRYHRCSLPDGKPSLVSRHTGSHLPMRLSSAGRESRT